MVIPRRTGWTEQIALRPLVAALCCAALIAAGCSSDDGLAAGDAATFREGTSGEVSLDGDRWERRGDGQPVPDGARVRALDGEVRLELRDGTVVLAPGSAATIAARSVTLDRGDLLLDSTGGVTAKLGDTTIAPEGVVRVTGGLAARVGVYRGSADIRRPAQERQVAQLRQLDLAAFRLAPSGDPLRYRDNDAWDQDLLGDAIAFDGEVARLARGLDVEFGTRPKRPAFYREFTRPRVVPALATAAPVTQGRAFGPPSDVLLTMFVAQSAQGRLLETVRTVTALRRDGARWGLIAMELDVASDALVAAVDSLDSERLALDDRTAPAGTAVAVSGPGTGADRNDGSAGATAGTDRDPTDGAPSERRDPSPPEDEGDDSPKEDDPGDDDPPPSEDPNVEDVVSDVVRSIEEDPPDDDDDGGDDDGGSGVPSMQSVLDLPLLP
jgi:hypothetical protein